MTLLLLLVIAAVVVAVIYRRQIQIAYQERRLSNAIKNASDSLAAHETEAVAAAQKVIADAKSQLARLKADLAKK